MALKIEAASAEELEQEFGTSTSGNDPETVAFIRDLDVGKGFKVTADAGETDRMVKRRINACAKEDFRELDWRTLADGKTLAVRVKAIDVDAEKKAKEEAEAKAKAEAEAKAKAEAEAKAHANGKPLESPEKQREPAKVGGGA